MWNTDGLYGINYGQQVVVTKTCRTVPYVECYVLGDRSKASIHLDRRNLYPNSYSRGLGVYSRTWWSGRRGTFVKYKYTK